MRIAVILAALLLTGCAGMSTLKDYDSVSPKDFEIKGEGWTVMDKPLEGRMVLQPSMGRAMKRGLKADLNFESGYAPEAEYSAAALFWISSTGRNCTVTSYKELFGQASEIHYRC